MKTKITAALATRNLNSAKESLNRTIESDVLSTKQKTVKVAASKAAIARWTAELNKINGVSEVAPQGSVKINLEWDREANCISVDGTLLVQRLPTGDVKMITRIGKPMMEALYELHQVLGFKDGTEFIWEAKRYNNQPIAKVSGEQVLQLLAPKHNKKFIPQVLA